jgi:hypothetical protein
MRSFKFVLLALTLVGGAVACSEAPTKASSRAPKQDSADNDDKDDEKTDTDEEEVTERSSSSSTATPTPTPEAPAAPATPTFPRAAGGAECPSGDGVYCNGNGVDGVAGTLYRCTGGNIAEEKKCATACMFMPRGTPDACDGDTTKCPRGSGLYCGTNYLSGDPKTLYRCTAGAITVEQACATSCVKEPDGTPDRCE